MIHFFKFNDEYLLYDVESSALMFIDKIVFDILCDSQTLHKDFSKEDIKQAKLEIQQLKDDGIIDGTAVDFAVEKDMHIKALCLHVSHDCNLRCKYCFAGTGTYHGQRSNMSLDVAKKAIDLLISNSGKRHNLEVDFFGGEPLMNFDVLKQTVEYAKQQGKIHNKNFKFTTTTNGVLLDQNASQYLNDEMDNVVLSLDGKKETNDFHRPTANGKGSFDVILDKLKYFRSIRGEKSYFVRGTFTHKNSDFADDVLAMAEMGFDQISIEPVVLPDQHVLALTDEDIEKACENYEKLANIYVEKRKDPASWFSFFHFALDLENGPCSKKRLVGCGAGTEYLAITPDGSVYPCHQFAGEKEFLLGNVFEKQLNQEKRQVFAKVNVNSKHECSNCWAKYHCSGGCSANAVHFCGDINKPYLPACQLMKKRLECALFIYAKEYC